MAKDPQHEPFESCRLSSGDDGVKAGAAKPPLARTPNKHLWSILLWLTLLFVGGGLAFLWPVFEAVGTGVAVGMIAAVLVLTLAPLLLLRTILKRASAETDDGAASRTREHEGRE